MRKGSVMYYCESHGGSRHEVRVWNDVTKSETGVADMVFPGAKIPTTEIKGTSAKRFYLDTSLTCDGWDVVDRKTGRHVAAFTDINEAEWARDEKNSVYSRLENGII